MRKVHLVLRLFFAAGLSIRAISRSIKASPSTVGDYIRRAEVAGLTWPLPTGMDESALEARLFPSVPSQTVTLPGRCPIGPTSTASSSTKASPCRCCGRSTKPSTPMTAYSTPSSASTTGAGESGSMWSCAKPISPARNCSSTTPAKPLVLLRATPESFVKRKCSSPYSVRPTTPSPKPPGARPFPIGVHHTPGHCVSSVAPLSCWCPTICAPPSPNPTAMSPTSTPPTKTWPSTTASPSSPPAFAAPKTRPKSKSASNSSSAGYWPCFDTAPSSP